MKKLLQPPFKQNTIALGFTFGVHAIAIVGLLFLGLSKPPEEPKKITTVLVNPEDLPPLDKPVEVETTAENEAPEVQSPVVDNTLPENTPVTPPQPTDQQLAAEKQKSEKAEQAKLAEQKRKADEVAKEKTAADKAANDKAAADKAAKDKAAADKASKDKAAADKA
ncbi:MAG: protein TolA, partial [Acinetobacter sp.]